MYKIAITIFFFLLSLFTNSYTQILEGFVYDEEGTPLVGTNIYLVNSNIGTTSNQEGHFLIKLKSGNNQIIFSYIGFQSETLTFSVEKNETKKINIILKQSSVTLPEITVSANELNEAENIIKKVIANKNNYLDRLKNYSYDAYTKTVLLVPSDDTLRYGGITQTLSRGFFEQPDKFQEVILSKKQTKNITEANNIFSIGKIPNVLDENLTFDDEKIISPLNKDAFDYYFYDIIDTIYLSSKKVFNIKFQPKNKNIHLFNGKLSIVDEIFVPVKVELYGENSIITKIRKNIIVKQQFREYEEGFWLPIEIIYNSTLDLGIPGIPYIYLNQLSLISDYQINNSVFNHTFDKYILTTKIVSDIQADSLWKYKQIIPLTNQEVIEFERIDSVVANGGFLTKLSIWFIQTLTSIGSLPITNFNDFFHFNRVEGNYIGFGLNSKKFFNPFEITFKFGYGFSDKKEKYFLSLSHQLNNTLTPFIEMYNKVNVTDRFYGYQLFDVTYQSLFYKNDYANYYYTKGINIGVGLALYDNLNSKLSFFFEEQAPALVNTNFSIFNTEKEFQKLIPIENANINAISFSIKYDNQNYYNYGYVKTPDYSDNFTQINFDYLYSASALISDYSFQQIHFAINHFQKISSLLNLNVNVRYGILIDNKIEQYKFHLPGNYGTFAKPFLFRTILKDNFSGDNYLVFCLENNFRNTLFNLFNIPLLEQSKYDLIGFFNWGTIRNNKKIFNINNKIFYSEVGFGISNILSFFRLDFTWQLSTQTTNNFVFSITSSL